MSVLNEGDLLKAGQFEEAISRVVAWAKQYVADYVAGQPVPVDPTMAAVIQALDQLNGEVIGTTASDKVSAALVVKQQMATIFANNGFLDTNIFRKFPSFLLGLTQATGVYIEDTNGDLWTAENWTNLHTTEVAANMVLVTSAMSFRIGFGTTSLAWGANQEVKGLPMLATANDVWNNTRDALDCTKAIIAYYNPAVLGMDANGVYSKTRLLANLSSTNEYFETYADMVADATRDISYCYIVNTGGTTDGTGMHCYYWNNAEFVDLGVRPVSQGSDPYKGAPAHVYNWKYKAYTGDEKQWFSPRCNMLRVMYQNLAAIQACYQAAKGTALNPQAAWGVEQASLAGAAWYVGMSNGSLSSTTKNSAYMVFPVAAFE